MEEAKAVPLIERLRRIPQDARLTYEHDPCSHSMFPVGLMAHEAADELEAAMKAKELPSDATQRMAKIMGCEFVPTEHHKRVEAKELPLETVERVAACCLPGGACHEAGVDWAQHKVTPAVARVADALAQHISAEPQVRETIARAAIASMGDRLPHEGVFVQLLIQTLDLSDELLESLEECGNLQAVAKAIIAECTTSLGTDGGELP